MLLLCKKTELPPLLSLAEIPEIIATIMSLNNGKEGGKKRRRKGGRRVKLDWLIVINQKLPKDVYLSEKIYTTKTLTAHLDHLPVTTDSTWFTWQHRDGRGFYKNLAQGAVGYNWCWTWIHNTRLRFWSFFFLVVYTLMLSVFKFHHLLIQCQRRLW